MTNRRVGREHRRGSAHDLHHRDLVDEVLRDGRLRAAAVWCDYSAPALVLGSRQPTTLADGAALAAHGLELATRRSGGGAVLMVPGALTWIDLVAAPGVFADDVRASMVAAGQCWVRALTEVGAIRPDAAIEVFDGPMRPGAWGELICFAGLGAGEVLVDGHKLVGLSQRRTRAGVRISGAVHHRSLVADTVPLLDAVLPESAPPTAATIAAVDPASLARSLASSLIASLASASDGGPTADRRR